MNSEKFSTVCWWKSMGNSPVFWVCGCNSFQLIFSGETSDTTFSNPSWWISKSLSSSIVVWGGGKSASLGYHTLWCGDLPDPSVLAPSNAKPLVAEFHAVTSVYPHLWGSKLKACCRVLLQISGAQGKETFKKVMSVGEKGMWLIPQRPG